jgi:hypothetical protein
MSGIAKCRPTPRLASGGPGSPLGPTARFAAAASFWMLGIGRVGPLQAWQSTGPNRICSHRGVLRLRNWARAHQRRRPAHQLFPGDFQRPAHHKELRPTASCPTPRCQIDNGGPRGIPPESTPQCSKNRLRASCSLAGVVVEESAETRPAFDRVERRVVVVGQCLRPDDLAADPLVGALGQVVLQELLDQVPQVTLAENDEVVQALGPDRFYEALRVRVAVWDFAPESERTSRRLSPGAPSTPP